MMPTEWIGIPEWIVVDAIKGATTWSEVDARLSALARVADVATADLQFVFGVTVGMRIHEARRAAGTL